MLNLHCSDTPYANTIVSAYSVVNRMLEATSSSRSYHTCSPVASGKHSLSHYKQNMGTDKVL